eukprot:TRINITY_DN11279_c0_g1_i1.p1 TRINITY_DN11279_c0_g1~~TRINITY_DN11279_c0_g1_i1.p1  ORF type:complete len:150 (+),score=12.38 TRINITY_DN11279_c0_g1_i1:106-555(+)
MLRVESAIQIPSTNTHSFESQVLTIPPWSSRALSEGTQISIPLATTESDGLSYWVVYHILVKKERQHPYTITKRYTEFSQLRYVLSDTGYFPRKTLWRDLSSEFIERRRKELQVFLNRILRRSECWPELWKFLEPSCDLTWLVKEFENS